MKHLIEMIKLTKKQGKIPVLELSEEDILDISKDFFPTGLLLDHLDELVPFVFSECSLVSKGNIFNVEDPIDAPFTIFSIEMLSDQPLNKMMPGDDSHSVALCIVCIEAMDYQTKKKAIVPILLVEYDGDLIGQRYKMVCVCKTVIPLVKAYVDKINSQELGIEETNHRVRVGNNKRNKKIATIKKVVHVRPKSNRTTIIYGRREIDWTHRWFVRGHWRKINGLGKNRDGEYCVENRTWVKSCEKGPENAPLVKKTRFVKGMENDNSRSYKEEK